MTQKCITPEMNFVVALFVFTDYSLLLYALHSKHYSTQELGFFPQPYMSLTPLPISFVTCNFKNPIFFLHNH